MQQITRSLVVALCVSLVEATWPSYVSEACSIYCYGSILETIQLSGIYNDSKTFVDMPMKFDPAQVQVNFDALPNTDVATLQTFLENNFLEEGSDLQTWIPSDFSEDPAFLESITSETIREWASDINQLWLKVCYIFWFTIESPTSIYNYILSLLII